MYQLQKVDLVDLYGVISAWISAWGLVSISHSLYHYQCVYFSVWHPRSISVTVQANKALKSEAPCPSNLWPHLDLSLSEEALSPLDLMMFCWLNLAHDPGTETVLSMDSTPG